MKKSILIVLALSQFVLSSCVSGTPTPAPIAGSGDEILACLMAQDFVKDRLKAPTTAKFAHCRRESASYFSNGLFMVTSYVDSQNSFGAMIRTTFTAQVRSIGNDKWMLEGLTTDP